MQQQSPHAWATTHGHGCLAAIIPNKKTWKQPKYPPVVEYYATTKWMNYNCTQQNEESHSQHWVKNKHAPKHSFILLNFPGTLVESQLTTKLRLYFWTLISISLVSILMLLLHCLWLLQLCNKWKSESSPPPTLFFFRTVLAILDPFHFQISCSITCVNFCKKGSWDFDRNYQLELW